MGAGNSAARAQREAQWAEQAKQQRINQTVGQINAIYDSPERQQGQQDFVKALREYYTQDATKQKEVADRQRKFSIARGGLAGGSADVDSRRTLGEEFQKGLLAAEDRAQGGLADLRAQDEQSRSELIRLAQSGLDATTAASRAASNIRASAEGAMATAKTGGLGDIFGATADTYKRQQQAAEFRRGQQAPVGSLYGNTGFRG